MQRQLLILGTFILMLSVFGCVSPGFLSWSDKAQEGQEFTEQAALEPTAIEKARVLFEEGKYEAALIDCIDLSRRDDTVDGLAELRNEILQALVDQRTSDVQERLDESRQRMAVETLEQESLPETYGIEKKVQGDQEPHSQEQGRMSKIIESPVTMHLKGATLSAFIDAVSRDKNINMIADKGLAQTATVDIEVDDVPLQDVLEYISRNLDISFFIGKNVIWVTKSIEKGGQPPLETRIYRLKRGLPFRAENWDSNPGNKGYDTGSLPALTSKATDQPKSKTSLEEVLSRFVPGIKGADFYVDNDTHVLIIKNTRDNFSLIEQILDNLDVIPPQVLIEARFIETTISDLRELGIEWMLETPLSGGDAQVEPGDILSYAPYQSDEAGSFPLGAQGDFGLYREGNPPTEEQGLNLTYHGILTEPMFKAVLHALDISGDGQTLSVPRVTTVNNSPAKLRNGTDLMYFNEFQAQAFNLVDANNQKYTITVLIPKGKPETEELGITLIAVPSVGSDLRTITLLLMPTISRLNGWSYYQDVNSTNSVDGSTDIEQVVAKLPIFERKEIQTKVITESGETVVLGGLIDTVRQETVHAVPFLSQLPFIGHFFKRLDVTEQRKNLLVFVTATVISERGEKLVPYY